MTTMIQKSEHINNVLIRCLQNQEECLSEVRELRRLRQGPSCSPGFPPPSYDDVMMENKRIMHFLKMKSEFHSQSIKELYAEMASMREEMHVIAERQKKMLAKNECESDVDDNHDDHKDNHMITDMLQAFKMCGGSREECCSEPAAVAASEMDADVISKEGDNENKAVENAVEILVAT